MASVTCGLTAEDRYSSGTLRSFRVWDYLYLFTADEMLCILCCRLFAERGVVYKVAQWWSGSGRIHFVTVAVLRPFRYAVRPIWQMILHTTSNDKVRVYANSTSNRISHRARSLLCPRPHRAEAFSDDACLTSVCRVIWA